MNVSFYTFSKRINSTARPTGGIQYNVILKEPSSVISPRLDLIWTGSGSPTAFNYAYIADFGRYYWIQNWEYHDRKWSCSLSVDVLASWKTEIGAAEKYVLRSASDYDETVADSIYPATIEEDFITVALDTYWGRDPLSGGRFVINITGAIQTANVAGTGSYQGDAATIGQIIKNAYDTMEGVLDDKADPTDPQSQSQPPSTTIEALGSLANKIVRTASGDLTGYINSLMWFPFWFPGYDQADVNVWLGVYVAGKAKPITSPIRHFDFTMYLTGPYGSQAFQDFISGDAWESAAPFATYSLEFMPFGTIEIDSVVLRSCDKIQCEVDVDSLSGQGTLKVYLDRYIGDDPLGAEERTLYCVRSAQVGVPIAIGGQSLDYGGIVSGLATGVAALVAPGAATVAAGTAGIASAANAMIPTTSSSGKSGGISGLDTQIRLWGRKLSHTEIDNVEHGKPLCSHRVLNTLSGYMECDDGDISAPATEGELQQIASFLTGGFFYD